MGAPSYADDITLISPILYGFNRMLDICNKFAIDNFIIFNSKKTICINSWRSGKRPRLRARRVKVRFSLRAIILSLENLNVIIRAIN